MNIRKTFQGAIVLSDIVNGQRIERQYMGYTLREAKRQFTYLCQQMSKQDF